MNLRCVTGIIWVASSLISVPVKFLFVLEYEVMSFFDQVDDGCLCAAEFFFFFSLLGCSLPGFSEADLT